MSDEARRCSAWLARLRRAGVDVKIPLICYYEIRREMARLAGDVLLGADQRGRWELALAWLDTFSVRLGIAGIDVKVMRIAADLWAESRRRGLPTASRRSLDVDVILAAIATRAARGNRDVRVVTTNVGHLSRYVPACRWEDYPLA
jgi:predicted nucleic acid-binding protein